MKKGILLASAFASGLYADALDEKRIKVDGFLDVFYVYDFNRPDMPSNRRQDFLFNHNRYNEFNVNLALVRFTLEEERYRGRVALQAGTYADDNYADEEESLKHINEASVGVALDADKELWLDGGIFASHIGFESAISADNPTLTRSLVAENTPYFLTGAKLTYRPSEAWSFLAVAANGWQRIERVAENSRPALGTQIVYTPSENLLVNYSTFVSYDEKDSQNREKQRILNNFYAVMGLTPSLELTAGLDIGFEEKERGGSYDHWVVPTLIARYQIDETYSTAFRAEYFFDPDSIIIATSDSLGFETLGLSSNLDYAVGKEMFIRFEARYLRASESVLSEANKESFFLSSSLALKF